MLMMIRVALNCKAMDREVPDVAPRCVRAKQQLVGGLVLKWNQQMNNAPLTTARLCPKAQQGATLIEILVTMLVVAIGLLGAAGLQLSATRFQQTAQIRTQAVIQAKFITEKIRANSNAVMDAAPPNATSAYLAPQAYAAATLAVLPADPNCGVATACTSAQAAVKDMRDWRTSIQALPGGRGAIFPVTAAGGATDQATRQVVVMWQEKQQNEVGTAANSDPTASVDAGCPPPQLAGVRCFTVLVTP
ncbi:type IV pilus modification protein PilV [Polaromonas sp.]|uniref:type IV pilus modification protein PilV n=1 Tax=Polaromonas sp. TaxID=1869339 RepID=UPI0013B5BF50|nr:type IV pilus modification protein PilV [Polaromonas sp.]NDP64263.1 type IV pilus modification protein PilV [Polaromonas sp.]